MLLLAFDTATAAITVALHDGTSVVARAEGEGSMAHAEQLAPAIASVVREAGATMRDLTDVSVGVGPGPFTGLRVGVVTALTLGETLGLATHGVCTLDVLAAEVESSEPFVVATDARRKEVYWAAYAPDRSRTDGPAVSTPVELATHCAGLAVFGRGGEMYSDVLDFRDGPRDPSAAAMAELVVAGRVETLAVEPLYLRRPDAIPLAERR